MREKIFPKDELAKKERVIRTLAHQPVDRAALHDQLSFNPGVIGALIGKKIDGFSYTVRDIGKAVSLTLDCCFGCYAPYGTETYTDGDGFVYKGDNWTAWRVSRPFSDEYGAADWLRKCIVRERQYAATFDGGKFRAEYREYMRNMRSLVSETVVMDFSIGTGFCNVFDKMGLEIFSFFQDEYPRLRKNPKKRRNKARKPVRKMI